MGGTVMAGSATIDLGDFDGHAVRGTSIKITNAGDGLSKALKTKPQLLHMGDTVFIVMEAKVGPITHDPIDDSDDVVRKHTCKASTVALVDEKQVRAVLDAQAEANERLKEEESGALRLNAETAREGEHVQGLHKRARKDCPLCRAQTAEGAREIAQSRGRGKLAAVPDPPKVEKPKRTRTKRPPRSTSTRS